MIIRRDTSTGSNDLNVVYRPCTVDEIISNDINKNLIRNALDSGKVPHTQLFVGGAGLGKTTAARIVALGLNCETNGVSSKPCLECNTCKSILEGNSIDIKEINVGQSGGKDYVSAIIKDLPQSPFSARYKVIIFDEAHKLTPDAKDLLLKPTENGYSHVYFIFCTNQPEKLMTKTKNGNPFMGRCSALNFSKVPLQLISDLLKDVCEFEGFPYSKDIIDVIVSGCEGTPRVALTRLNQVALEGSWEIAAVQSICNATVESEDPQVIELCRAINEGNFKLSIDLFEKIDSVSVETLRIIVANYFVSCLKRSKRVQDGNKYSKILDIILEPIHEQGKLSEYKWYNYMYKMVEVVISCRRA